ncbi:MAG: response regulator [Acidaminococcaceae bacterium]|nr:response regulator [Acidaminococcaceae bacterium]
MDGTISVESELGKGTTFYLRFVIPCVPTTVVRQQEAVKLKKELDVGILQGKQILICEDHPINQEIVIRILERVGMVVTKANNGKEAVEVFKQSAPDFFRIILMDIRMPIMDGLAATKEIRALDRQDAKKIPIIAMSANAFDEDVKTSLAVGMNAHLSKPINPNLLYQTIAKYI